MGRQSKNESWEGVMVEATEPQFKEYAIEEFLVRSEPYYRPVGDEMELFTAAYEQHIPVLLKGPTGCGKTRFVEYMAWKLGRPLTVAKEMIRAGIESVSGNVSDFDEFFDSQKERLSKKTTVLH
jgi:hypothetical protein